jgi:hypothetical protein
MTLTRRTDTLRLIAERLKLDEMRQEARKPGVGEAFRITIYHHDGHAPNSVATLRRLPGGNCKLNVSYDTLGKNRTYDFSVPLERHQKLLAALRLNKFDEMDDEPDLPYYGVDLWLVERSSGSFHHDVVLSPESARGHYRELVVAVRTYLPEAVREIIS